MQDYVSFTVLTIVDLKVQTLEKLKNFSLGYKFLKSNLKITI